MAWLPQLHALSIGGKVGTMGGGVHCGLQPSDALFQVRQAHAA